MKHNAIYQLYPQVKYIIGDVAYDANDEVVEYDNAAVDSVVNSTQYQRDRAIAYPSMAEQLDMQYWDRVNGTTVWADTIAAIKSRFPKD